MERSLRTIKGLLTIFLPLTLLGITLLYLPDELLELLIEENGPIEMMTAVGLFVAAMLLFWHGYRQGQSLEFTSGILLFFLGLRELDFHCRFTTMGIFKTRFFISDQVPTNEKIIVTLIVCLLFLGLVWYTKTHFRKFMQNLREGQIWATCIALAIAVAVISKTVDRMSDYIAEIIFTLFHFDSSTFLRIFEETSELAIPLFILMAIVETRGTYQEKTP